MHPETQKYKTELAQLVTRINWLQEALARPAITRSLEKKMLNELDRVTKRVATIQATLDRMDAPKRAKALKVKGKAGRPRTRSVDIEPVEVEGAFFDVDLYGRRHII